MGKRQEAALETRRRLLEAVKALLEEKPAERINIEEITNQAGVAKGSFYTYFKRKEDIISEVALEEYQQVKELAASQTEDACQQLCIYLKKSVELIEKSTLQVAQQWMKSVVSPLKEESSGTKKYNFDRENIEEILFGAVQRETLQKETPVEILSEMILNHYYGAVAVWCINRGENGSLTASMERFCSYELEALLERYRKKA